VEEGWGDTRAPYPTVSRGGAGEQDRLDVDDVLFTNRDRRHPPDRCLRRACARMRRPPEPDPGGQAGRHWLLVRRHLRTGKRAFYHCWMPVPCRRAPWSGSLSVA